MADYYGVEQVEKLGTLEHTRPPRARGDERLVMVLDNGIYRIAADVTDSSEYEEHHSNYARGHWITYDVYRVPASKLALCPNTGRAASKVGAPG